MEAEPVRPGFIMEDDEPAGHFAERPVGAEERPRALALPKDEERLGRVFLLPGASGLDVAAAIHREALPTEVVVLTMYRDAGLFRHALDHGVKGYVLKDAAVVEIVACLHMVAAGRAYISPALSSELLDRYDDDRRPEVVGLADLTPAERRVLRLIARGLTTAGIAAELGNSPKTIENHRSHICQKLGLEGPQAVLRFALERKALLE